MRTLSDKMNEYERLRRDDVKQFIKDLKEELRGIPVRESHSGNGEKYQDIIEIWKRIDKLAGDKLI